MASPIDLAAIVPSPIDIVQRVNRVFGDSLLGAYLYGSATLGGLQKHSDVDVLAVIARLTSEDERRALVDLMMEISGSRATRGPTRPVELTLVVQEEVRPWRYPPRSEFQYGEWLRHDYELGTVPAPAVSPDLATLLSMVRGTGQSIIGPPPDVLLDPVPQADLRRAMIDALPELLADLETDHNVVLTLARIWMTLETREMAPKDVAADWALQRVPRGLRPALAHARAVYLGEEAEHDLDVPAVRRFAEQAVEQIQRAYRRETNAA